jgi:hypothetical protein
LDTPNLGASVYFDTKDWPPFMITNVGLLACTENIYHGLLQNGLINGASAVNLPILRVEVERKKAPTPSRYKWLYPRENRDIESERLDDTGSPSKDGCHHRHLFRGQSLPPGIFRPYNGYQVVCSIEFLYLARANKWTGLWFRPSDAAVGDFGLSWSIDYLGKQWPPQWWPDGYEPHPSNVIETEVPDVKIGEGLVGELAPAPAKASKTKPVKNDGPLLSASAIRGLKLEESGGYELAGEVPLSRPLYGAETLSITVGLDGDGEEGDAAFFSPSRFKTTAQAILSRLEPLLPLIHAKLLEEGAPHASSPEAFVESLHSPSILLTGESLGDELWSFVVESDVVGFHLEFQGDRFLEISAGD